MTEHQKERVDSRFRVFLDEKIGHLEEIERTSEGDHALIAYSNCRNELDRFSATSQDPDEELQADSKPVQNLESEGEWPVVKITSMGRAVPCSTYIEADARVVIPKGTERYYPVSHPLVLTPAEALLLVKARDDDELNVAEFDAAGELCNRLVEAAKGAKHGDR